MNNNISKKSNSTNKRTQPAKKTSKVYSKKRTNSRRKSKKVKSIPLDKALAFCLVIIVICLLVYFFSDYIKLKKSALNSEKTPVEKEEIKSKKQNISKTSENKNRVEQATQNKKTTQTQTKRINSSTATEKTDTKKEVASIKPPVKEVEKKQSKFDFPPIPWAQNNATLVFVFDDAGQNLVQLEKLLSLPFDTSFAVLPKLAYSKKSAEKIRASGKEVLLHQPMQSVNLKINPGPGAITPEMTEEEIYSVLFENVAEVGPVAGLNNHEGSLITSDAEKISYVMKFTSECGIFFLDSRTNADTKVPFVSEQLGYGYFERNIFLDNTQNSADIIKEIMKGINIANKKGGAIMIGHVWSAEILSEILKEMYPLLKEKGYIFSTVSKFNGIIRNI